MSSSSWPPSGKARLLTVLWTLLRAQPTPLPAMCHTHMSYLPPSLLVSHAPVPLSLFTDMLSPKVTHILDCFSPKLRTHLTPRLNTLIQLQNGSPTNPSKAQTVHTFCLHFIWWTHHHHIYDSLPSALRPHLSTSRQPAHSFLILTMALAAMPDTTLSAKRFKSVLNRSEPFTLLMLLNFCTQHAGAHADTLPASLLDWLMVRLVAGFRKSKWCQLYAQWLLSTHRLSPGHNPVAITASDITLHNARGAIVLHMAAIASLAAIMRQNSHATLYGSVGATFSR
eukprot:jgi/Psemu1/990/gm1.990_g